MRTSSLTLYKLFNGFNCYLKMDCEYCGLNIESNFVMRSSSINERLKTIYICTACFGEKLFKRQEKNERIFRKKNTTPKTLSGKISISN